MPSDVKRITDKSVIAEIYKRSFLEKNVFIKTNVLNIQVQSFNYTDGRMVVKIGGENLLLDNPVFYVRNNEDVIFSHANLVSHAEDNIYIFDPVDIQLMKIPRKEERKHVEQQPAENREPVFISGIVSDFQLRDELAFNRKKVEFLKDEILKKIQPTYPDSTIYIIGDKGINPRMDFFVKERIPYFISDINDKESLNQNPVAAYYIETVLPQDPDFGKKKTVSEIAVPLFYRFMMPFGYIQVNRDSKLKDEDYTAIKKMGMTLSTVFSNDKQMIKSGDEKIGVTDMSESGLCAIFRERTLIKYFKDNSTIVFSLYLPGKKQTNMFCIVRNITILKNNIYRVGCEILGMDSIGEVHYGEYLEGLS